MVGSSSQERRLGRSSRSKGPEMWANPSYSGSKPKPVTGTKIMEVTVERGVVRETGGIRSQKPPRVV